MKKCNAVSCFQTIIVIALIVALSGYGKNSVSIPDGSKFDAGTAVKEEITEWPDNIYTQAIIKPKTGVMDYVVYDEQAEYYALFLKDVSMEEGEQYIQSLQENGFVTAASDSNSIAVGEVLQKDNIGLCVSVSENVLGLCITLNDEKR